MSNEFEVACRRDEIADGQMRLLEISQRLVILVRDGDNYYCIDDVCTHDGGTLSDGQRDGLEIECPRHGARFDLRTGKALCMPATRDTTVHQVKLDGDQILVRITEG